MRSLDCQHVKVRFGFLPTEGYNKLMSSYADDLWPVCRVRRPRPATGAST
ncbi:MAG: hypothetical protein ACLTY5_06265 [Angelakisella sp.]